MISRISLLVVLAAAVAGQIYNSNALLLRYSFDSLPPVDQGNFERGTAFTLGQPTSVQGKIGNAARFNPKAGDGDSIYYAGQWMLAAPLTITAWFSVDQSAVGQNYYMKIISQKVAYNDAQGIELQYNPQGQTWTVVLPGTAALNFKTTGYPAGEWHHVAATVSAGQAILYIDGNRVADAGYGTPLTGNRGKSITVGGSAALDKINGGGAWHGVIDELRVYNYVLNGDEIKQVYQQGDLTAAASGPASQTFPAGQSACPGSDATPATPALWATVDNLPKGSDGKTLPNFPKNSLVLHNTQNRLDHIETPWNNKVYNNYVNVHDSTTITVNAVKAVTVSAINVDKDGIFTVGKPNLPATLQAGDKLTINVKFTGTMNDKGALRTALHIVSDDAAQPSLDITMAGLFMLMPEGGHEVPYATIVNAFGFGTLVGIEYMTKIQTANTPIMTDEVATEFLQAADPTKPIGIYQIAAFGGITDPDTTHDFKIIYENTNSADCAMKLKALWAQTILPECANTGDQRCWVNCNPGTRKFSINMDGWTSVPSNLFQNNALDQIAWRFFVPRDKNGAVIPDTIIAGQDYSLEKGCCDGDGCANCDYQDNIYVFTNTKPAARPTKENKDTAVPFSFSFNTTTLGNSVDKNGNGLPFSERFGTNKESRLDLSGYNADNIFLNTAQQSLVYNAVPGSPLNKAQSLQNAFVTKFDPQGKSFVAQTTLNGGLDAAAYAGLILGTDQRNFFTVYVKGNAVFAYAAQVAITQTTGTFPTYTDNANQVGTATLPAGFQSLTLYILADQSTNKIYAAYSADNGAPVYFSPAFSPAGESSSGFGANTRGRFFLNGVGAGPIAWSDAGSLPVTFKNFGVDNCNGAKAIVTGTEGPSTTSSSSTSSAAADNTQSGNNGNNSQQPSNSTPGTPTSAINNDPAASEDPARTSNRGQNGSGSVQVPALFFVAATVLALMA